MNNEENIKQCPYCEGYIFKPDNLNTNRVECPMKKEVNHKDFCWICLHQWGNDGCSNKYCGNLEDLNNILAECELKKVEYTKHMVPSRRACPNC
jgi:hypothetical protein